MPAIEISRSMLVNHGLSAVSELTRLSDDGDGLTSVDAVASFKRLVSDSLSVVDLDLVATITAFNSPLDMATYFINAKYAELGGSSGMLGTTTSAIVASPGGAGFVRTFQHGAIYFHPQVGAHELHGPVRVRWQELGGDKGFLGFPTSDVTPGADVRSEGVFAHFQGGSIYWAPLPRVTVVDTVANSALTATMITPVAGAASAPATTAATSIARPGLAASTTLSTAVTTAATTRPPATGATTVTAAAGTNRIDTLAGGVLEVGIIKPVVESSAGAFEVHGAIREKYLALGAEASILGYPRTDETGTPDGIGRYNHFQGGSIYWTPATYAHEVHGLIRDRWASQGWERNPQLGYPISDEMIPDLRIGHRRPEARKKPVVALPNDVIKLPAEAALAGFPSTVVNTPITPARVSETKLTTPKPTTTTATAATTVLPTAGSALGRLSDRTDTAIVTATVTIDPALIGILVNTPASTAADARSLNRFSDFENGVLFWFRGATAATTLTPLASFTDGTSVSFSAADISAAAIAKIGRTTFEGGNARVSAVNFVGTTAYSFDGAQTHNRRHRVQVVIAGTEGLVPVTATIELQVEAWFDASKRQIALTPTDWTLTQASSGSYADNVRAILRTKLDPILWTSYELTTLPDTDGGAPIAVLSVKTLGNGAVAVFIEPHSNPALTVSGIATGVLAGVVLSQPN